MRVRVPASTSNLGPGFDLLGLALSIFLEVEATLLPAAEGHRITRLGALEADLGDPSEDLMLRAFEAVTKQHSLEGYYHFTQKSDIPTGRGLGSSGTAIAAGLLLARALNPGAVSLQDLISIGIELEGHPDNLVASLLGGLTLCQTPAAGQKPLVLQPSLHPSIAFAVVWPDTQLSTKDARTVLPEQVPFPHAVHNPGALAYLLEGLRSGSPEMLRAGGQDRLHVPYRLDLIRGAGACLRAAEEAGAWLATISGSGSTLIALGPKERIEAIGSAMQSSLAREHTDVQARTPLPVFGTPEVESSEA